MAKLRLLLADDHEEVRASLRRRLSARFEVVAAVGDGKSLLEQARRLAPDIILSDITMPDMNGLEVARQLIQELPNTKIVFVTVHTSRAYIREAFRAGARGYVVKSSSIEELEEALREVQNGSTYVSKRLGCNGGVIDRLKSQRGVRTMEWKDAKSRLDQLTGRIPPSRDDTPETELIRLIVEQLDHLHKEAVRFEARLEELATRLASLEARVHEDVE